jgi:hypothetical protein
MTSAQQWQMVWETLADFASMMPFTICLCVVVGLVAYLRINGTENCKKIWQLPK